MNIKKKFSSITSKTLLYLILFSVVILFLLWLFQIIYFRFFYEYYQVRNMNHIASSILSIEGSLDQNLEAIAYQNEVCIEVFWNNNTVSRYNTLMVGCGLGKNNKDVAFIQESFLNNTKSSQAFRIENNEYKTKAYLYGIKTNIGTIFLYSPLEDLSGASLVLRSQLIYMTIIAVLFASFIAYFLSRKITRPILDITKKAKDLGKKDNNVTFPISGVEEVDELAHVLQNAQEELAKTDELRRDLMANVSHDLKTPLTMIKAYAEMVRDISYKNDEKRQLHCNIIMNETDRLNILVNDILELSKMQASADELHCESFDLMSEIKEIISRYEIIKETEEYHFQLHGPNKAFVYADKKKLNQVIYNLMNNAINYTGKDKTVIVKVKREKERYLVEVIDSGKGIKPEDLEIIWDKYYKNEKNHQRNIVGTGIGLSIVKTILERHGFQYGVKSKKDKGSNFYFYVNKK